MVEFYGNLNTAKTEIAKWNSTQRRRHFDATSLTKADLEKQETR